MNETSPFRKKPQKSLAPLAMWGHSLWTGKRAITTQWICHYFDLGLPSFQNCEKQTCKVFSLWCFFFFFFCCSIPETKTLSCFKFWPMLLDYPPEISSPSRGGEGNDLCLSPLVFSEMCIGWRTIADSVTMVNLIVMVQMIPGIEAWGRNL